MDDAPGRNVDDEEGEDRPEQQVVHLNEVTGPEVAMVVGDEVAPALTGVGVGVASDLPHDPLDGTHTDLDADLEELAADAFGTPTNVLQGDAPDQSGGDWYLPGRFRS